MTPEQTLKQYFGYDQFRPLQKEIVQSVLDGKDTIALLPTGGGKSICFQVPALMMEGVCVVVTPLIALMKDQVENLKKRDIMAIALFGGMKRREIEFELENCINGKYKFLYVSPERLMSKHFIDYAVNINVSMLAIDEAHCISQWGYDFRPPYLEIAAFKNKFDQLKTIALTASATKEVVIDIGKRLELRNTQIFTQSFVRSNLSYVVQKTENKIERIIHICERIKGTGLIYVKSRRRTQDLSNLLNQRQMKTDFYHAGLEPEERNRKQEEWKKGKTRIMVCTNAFGMGIDKPDVRFVIHEQKPDTLEAYYQEAGRAGRDGEKSYCVMLFHESDLLDDQKNIEAKYPSSEQISRIYELICNDLKVGVGSGINQSFDFDIQAFSQSYKLQANLVYNVIKILENESYFQTTEAFYLPSRLKILVDDETISEWQEKDKNIYEIFKTLLRSYGGLFDFYTNIYEYELARRLNKSDVWLKAELKKLHDLEYLDYVPQSQKPQIVFIENRFNKVDIPKEKINYLRKRYYEKLKFVNDYLLNSLICRSSFIVDYFGEINAKDCGVCDVCLDKKKSSDKQFLIYYKRIQALIQNKSFKKDDLLKLLKTGEIDEIVSILRWLIDESYLIENQDGIMTWANEKLSK
jgi:ATP-dependent DNA helicase RecQ